MIEGYFDQLDTTTDASLLALAKTITPTNDNLFAGFSELISSLDKTNDGYIKSTVSNLKKLSQFDKIFAASTTGYISGVKSYIKGFSTNQNILNEYFLSLESGFVDKSIYEIIRQGSVETTINSLTGIGIDSFFKEPLRTVLQNIVVNGGSKTEAINTLKNYIYGQGDRVPPLDRYVSQVAEDSIAQFNGSYIATVSDDLGLNYYYYRGTKIADTRDFCQGLAGKYASFDTLESYVNKKASGNGWAGMIPGTNMSNFITYRGGYRCRHYLIPVSKTVYDANKSKQL